MLQYCFFLLSEFLFVFLLAYWNRKYNNSRLNNFLIALFSAVFFYISIIVIVIVIKYLTEKELDSFDLNVNGFMEENERTTEYNAVLAHASNDTGLCMAPFTGIFFSIIYFILIIIPLAIFNRRKKANNKITE